MPQQKTTRRQFVKQSVIAATVPAIVYGSLNEPGSVQAKEVDRSIRVQTPPAVRQIDVLFDPANYAAFPHVVRLDGDELLMALRQAPRQEQVRHTHPRSVITVIRSYDLGETWDADNAGHLAAGGGQEFAPIHMGNRVVGGLLAMHEVVPIRESQRASIPHNHSREHPFRNVGGFWCWSNNHGLTWQLHHNVLFAPSNVVYRSDDNGETWSAPTVMAKGVKTTRDYYEPCILELARGHLLAMHRVGRCQDGRLGLFWQNESRDGGKSWTEPIETTITSGACPRLLKLSDARVLLTYGRRYEPYGLYARLSGDGGKSWRDTSWLLRAAPNSNQGYSSSVELSPGRIFTTCYAENNDGVTGITGTFWSLPPQ